MYKFILLFFQVFLFVSVAGAGDDCLGYKLTPNISVRVPMWEKNVVQPLQKMDVLHGNVIATMVDNYEINTDITSIEDGFCVALKDVDAIIGYTDFLVQIDISHRPNSCSYNAILSHEDEHIRAYLSIIDDNYDLIKKSLMSAANSITPIFVEKQSDIDGAVDNLNEQIQTHPDIILLKQQIKAAEEIRNKRVDQTDNGRQLKDCF